METAAAAHHGWDMLTTPSPPSPAYPAAPPPDPGRCWEPPSATLAESDGTDSEGDPLQLGRGTESPEPEDVLHRLPGTPVWEAELFEELSQALAAPVEVASSSDEELMPANYGWSLCINL